MTLTPTFRSASRVPGGPILAVQMNDNAGTCVLGLSGHLDSRSTIGLEAELDQLQGLSFDEMVIDVENLRSIDAAGFATLVRLCRHVSSRGRAVRIVSGEESCDLTTGFRRLARRAPRGNRIIERVQGSGKAARQPGPRRLGGSSPSLLFGD